MFDDLKNLNLGDLMNKAKGMQDQMQRLQAEMAKKTVTADAGGGMVQATVNGKMELVKLQIDKAKPVEGEVEDYSIIYSASGDGRRFEFSTGWGGIKVVAGSVRVALD